METKARLLYKSYMTYFHTFLPVWFYGMPNGKIYCMYARFFDGGNSISELEFVFAEHEDYSFNYETGELMGNGDVTLSLQAFKEMVDQPEQRIRIVKIYRGFTSYAEAQKFLNHQSREMVSSLPLEIS